MANCKTFLTLRLVNLGVHNLPYGQKVYTQKLIMLKSPLMSKDEKKAKKFLQTYKIKMAKSNHNK